MRYLPYDAEPAADSEDALEGAIAFDDESDEATYDERGPVCAKCGDPLPLGLAGKYCDECVEPDMRLASLF